MGRMRHRITLPRHLGDPFSLRAAAAIGIGPGRYDAADLHRPFPGVRSTETPSTFVEHVACYTPRLRPGQRYGGRTAARWWGLPLPDMWTREEPLEVVVPLTGAPPKTAGVKGRRLSDDRAQTRMLRGVPVIDPVAAVFMCAKSLTVAQVVVVIDAVVTTAANYPDLGPERPMATLASIERRLDEWGRFPGCGVVRKALPHARESVESPKETETRLLLIEAGLPEPVVQFEVKDGSQLVARVDLAYPKLKVAIEYEGDGHRSDKVQWRRDIQRQRDLEARGWVVIRLTELDLGEGKDALIARIRQLIAERSA